MRLRTFVVDMDVVEEKTVGVEKQLKRGAALDAPWKTKAMLDSRASQGGSVGFIIILYFNLLCI